MRFEKDRFFLRPRTEDVEVVLGKVAVLQKVWDKAYKKRIEI